MKKKSNGQFYHIRPYHKNFDLQPVTNDAKNCTWVKQWEIDNFEEKKCLVDLYKVFLSQCEY